MKKIKDKKTIIIILSFVLLLTLIGVYSRREILFAKKAKISEPQPAIVKVQTAETNSNICENIVQNTSIEAVNRVKLTPRVTGRLEKIFVKRGDIVHEGEPVAYLEHEQQDALIGAAEAQKASAMADSEKAKAEMMNEKTNLERYKRLLDAGFSTMQQYDAASTSYASAKASYNAALAKERQAQSELKRSKSSKDDYIIKAPLNGTVLNDYSISAGTMISPSSPILDIADLSRLKATLKIPESKIFTVKKGMPVTIRFDALPDEEFKGYVTATDQYVEPSTRTSNVEIELDNKAAGGKLRPGMFGQASITEREAKNVIAIPESSLHSSESGFYVLVAESGKAKQRVISVGIRQGSLVEITKGLKTGDKVIIFGGKNLNDGDKITIE